jgi:hypothetical protein
MHVFSELGTESTFRTYSPAVTAASVAPDRAEGSQPVGGREETEREFLAHRDHIDLALLDVVLAEVNNSEVYAHIYMTQWELHVSCHRLRCRYHLAL